jgi:outer membrane receptor protein involved in Fe transport
MKPNQTKHTVQTGFRASNILVLLSLAASLISFSLPLIAQDEEESEKILEEVIVTASKRGEMSAQDLAGAITAFDSKRLDQLKALNFDDVIVQVPSTNFVNDGGPGRGNELASIRGLSAVADNTVGVVAQYLDGAPHFGNSYRIFDLAEFSVLRGPQGTLWGSQAIGGLVSMRSNRPDPTSLYGTVQGDAYSSKNDGGLSYRVYGMANIPVVEDTFGLRFAGHYIDETGYIQNIRTGTKGINDVKESAWRLSGLWNVTDSAAVTLIYHGNDLKSDAPTYFNTTAGGLEVDLPSDYHPTTQEYDLFNFIVDVDFGWGVFSYTGSFFSNEGSYSDFTDSAGFLQRFDNNIDEDSTTHEIRLASTSDSRFQWIVGYFYDDFDNFRQSVEYSPSSIEDPDPAESVRSGGLRTFKEQAIFGEISYDFTDKFRVLLGGRYFDWEVDDQSVFLFGGLDFGFVTQGVAGDDDTFYKIQLDYYFNDDVMMYGTRSEGFRPGGFNTFVGEELFGISEEYFEFYPDTLVNYEIGVKSRLADNRVTLNGAIYFLDWQTVQTVVQSDQAGAFGQGWFTTNAPDLEARGLELEFVSQDLFFPGFYAAAMYSYNKNEWQDDAQLFPGTRVNIRKGDEMRRTPRHTWSLDLGYDFQFGNGTGGYVRANYWHKDSTSTFGFNGNDGNVEVPAQDVINASAGAIWDRWELRIYINNLTDEDPWLNVFSGNSAGLPGGDVAIRANTIRSRTLGAEVTVSFGG